MSSQEKAKSPGTSGNAMEDQSSSDTGDADRTDAPDDAGTLIVRVDYIDEELEETFPASDPPCTAPTTSIGPPDHRVKSSGA